MPRRISQEERHKVGRVVESSQQIEYVGGKLLGLSMREERGLPGQVGRDDIEQVRRELCVRVDAQLRDLMSLRQLYLGSALPDPLPAEEDGETLVGRIDDEPASLS